MHGGSLRMCGRFSLQIDSRLLVEYFQLSHVDNRYQRHYNIAPGQSIAIIRQNDRGERYLEHAHWGLIPSWSKDKKIANKLINARSETADSKPSFRSAFKTRRCLIPADGFFEWMQSDGKQPYRITLPDNGPMAFAGLWEHWESPQTGEFLESCTILTTHSNKSLAFMHERMPAILQPDAYSVWLDQTEHQVVRLKGLLQPYPGKLSFYPVSRAVNSPANDTADVIQAIGPDTE